MWNSVTVKAAKNLYFSKFVIVSSFPGSKQYPFTVSYVLTFQATGCPNETPYLGWWRKQTNSVVFNDMFTYCENVKNDKATDDQKTQCCGDKECKPTSCSKQDKWKTGIKELKYIYHEVTIKVY